jgi:hypothetical protein
MMMILLLKSPKARVKNWSTRESVSTVIELDAVEYFARTELGLRRRAGEQALSVET